MTTAPATADKDFLVARWIRSIFMLATLSISPQGQQAHAQHQRAQSPAVAKTGSAASAPATKPPGSRTGETGSPPQMGSEALRPSDRESLQRLSMKFPSPCGKPHSLLTSISTDTQCRVSPIAYEWMAFLFRQGHTEDEVEQLYTKRFITGNCVAIDTSGAQVRGEEKAKVALIEFADFECEHCSRAEPLVRRLLTEFKNFKFIFMNYPQPQHASAATAAAAALAAGKQGKFWEYHDRLFAHNDHLRFSNLISYAKELKLDTQRFQADLEGARSRIAYERSIGEKLGINGTPAFFVGCKRLVGPLTIETLRSYVQAALASTD